MTEKNYAAGYIRVSNDDKPENSLSNQEALIRERAEKESLNLIEIYTDSGISGETIEKRFAFRRMINEIQRYDCLIVWELDRLGRSLRDMVNTVEDLLKMGIRIISVKEQFNLGTRDGDLTFHILSAIAEYERKLIRDRTHENKINLAKRGIPSSGQLPFGRKFDRQTGLWSLDEDKTKLIRWAASEYLNSKPLTGISDILTTQHSLSMTSGNLIKILKNRCGDTWTERFKGQEPITFNIPRILDEATIQAIKEKAEANQKYHNRTDIKRYPLTGYLRCLDCNISFAGQTQKGKYLYYRHPGRKCDAGRNGIPLKPIEDAIFKTIFENVYDETAFNLAIKESMPDETYIKALQDEVSGKQKALNRVKTKLDRIVDAVADGTIRKETAKNRESDLFEQKANLESELDEKQTALDTLPDIDKVKQDAYRIRLGLLDYFGSEDWVKDMTYEDKRRFLDWFFQGKDENGKAHGIYIKKTGPSRYAFLIYARLLGGVMGLNQNQRDWADNLSPEQWKMIDDNFPALHTDHINQDIPIEYPEPEEETEPVDYEWIKSRKPRFQKYKTSQVCEDGILL